MPQLMTWILLNLWSENDVDISPNELKKWQYLLGRFPNRKIVAVILLLWASFIVCHFWNKSIVYYLKSTKNTANPTKHLTNFIGSSGFLLIAHILLWGFSFTSCLHVHILTYTCHNLTSIVMPCFIPWSLLVYSWFCQW